MTETTPRREATVAKLVEAAIQEFAARGIDATSVEQLCEAAGYTRGAFYSNFATKDDLCVAVLEHYRDQCLEGASSAFSQPPTEGSVDWVLEVALPRYLALVAPNKDVQTTLMEIRLRATRNPELAERWAALSGDVKPSMVGLIDGIAASVGASFSVPTELLFEVFDALFFYEVNGMGSVNKRSLIGPVAKALVRAK